MKKMKKYRLDVFTRDKNNFVNGQQTFKFDDCYEAIEYGKRLAKNGKQVFLLELGADASYNVIKKIYADY